ncbi:MULTISPECIES: DegT/DnrJ/EryC1/StrS family aminotransferase [Rhodobacterales]|jgi:dTDP-4-amino-4,6-dideoxygalactose transaminase|uniref:DegT/DnrJ/EryC1/StrS family aminotransferase n=1 Tax=Rhodobacterales TaxID=204455 RepID=UPI00237EF8C7|nr:aminotransferase class I/II-fold pyridoxal phosphate-dependent enzyme [Phaeobacter gallaeciensis]MDE4138828.1 aminotransferase class I/II-fold pyridoxal phosphate-dependent enzyme [Phaeobacter gallaeciensis]MDE4148114.1 aminotransferase class I/II-fold pyridoxal phosphate-dependent enzyme [Phaeobacter gallaeciensis]MDE4152332.1 aminotransferase class I/II-fold pyridoxal phosphate-dependent enzyme [Phaeobacter gallaeciensis]MDE4226884.1 aminotransferase class I/II-fold pyridoxal phosphate-dep
MSEIFTGSFTQQEPIPEEAISAAMEVLRHGRLHRYNVAGDEAGETALLEREFADQMGAKYCLAVASGGYALATALRAVGVKHGDRVLTNAFTLAPVPGSIAAVGATPVYVDVTEDLTIDLEDLAAKADQADVLMLSHMRGHLCDMDRLMEICNDAGITVIEDCAHTMGAAWNGTLSGRHGAVGCYSCQTYKHVNSGEGGLLITDDEEIAARAIILSGSYMLYGRHLAAPEPEVFERVKYETPNISGRMDNLRAAILRPQLRDLEVQVARWNERYREVEAGVRGTPGLTVVERPAAETYVGSSIQFLLLDWAADRVQEVLRRCAARGVELKWFGEPQPVAFTSRYDSWRYAETPSLPKSDRILAGIVDMRVPLTFSLEDCAQIARIIRAEVGAVFQGA